MLTRRYTGNILSTSFAGLIAAGVFHLDGRLGYAGWQWLFIIQGELNGARLQLTQGTGTGIVALACFPFLPSRPLTTKWLKEEERQLAHSRLFRDRVDHDAEPSSTLNGLKQAVKDPRVWLFCLAQNLHLSANGFKNFFPSVISTLGFRWVPCVAREVSDHQSNNWAGSHLSPLLDCRLRNTHCLLELR